MELRGLSRHQSYAYQGYAMPDSIQRLDAQILKKDLGCNAVRTSHSPQSPAFLDACDELGLLVFTEMPGWRYIGDESWKAQALQNCREMVPVPQPPQHLFVGCPCERQRRRRSVL